MCFTSPGMVVEDRGRSGVAHGYRSITQGMRHRRRTFGYHRRQEACRERNSVRLLRSLRRGRRQLVLQEPQWHVGVLSEPAHRHLEVPPAIRGLSGTGGLAALPAPFPIAAVLQGLRRPLRVAGSDPVQQPGHRRRARRRGYVAGDDGGRRDRGLRRADRLQRTSLESSIPGLPGRVRRCAHAQPRLQRPVRPDRYARQADRGGRHGELGPRHRLGTVPALHRLEAVRFRPSWRVGVAQICERSGGGSGVDARVDSRQDRAQAQATLRPQEPRRDVDLRSADTRSRAVRGPSVGE